MYLANFWGQQQGRQHYYCFVPFLDPIQPSFSLSVFQCSVPGTRGRGGNRELCTPHGRGHRAVAPRCNESAGARVLFCLALSIFRVHLMKAPKFLAGNQRPGGKPVAFCPSFLHRPLRSHFIHSQPSTLIATECLTAKDCFHRDLPVALRWISSLVSCGLRESSGSPGTSNSSPWRDDRLHRS